MLNTGNPEGRGYSERPATPLGEETGITSASPSERATPKEVPRTVAPPGPYHYQPAIASTRPELIALRRNSTNYAQAQAESLRLTSLSGHESSHDAAATAEPSESARSFSFSTEDLKRARYEDLFKDEHEVAVEDETDQDHHAKKYPPQSPGVGNSQTEGREYGFSSGG